MGFQVCSKCDTAVGWYRTVCDCGSPLSSQKAPPPRKRTNAEVSVLWFKTALRWTFVGGLVGGLASPFVIHFVGERDVYSGIFSLTGLASLLAGFPPALVCLWYLFLHMIGQVSRSVRGQDD
jgi:hypothetical protein